MSDFWKSWPTCQLQPMQLESAVTLAWMSSLHNPPDHKVDVSDFICSTYIPHIYPSNILHTWHICPVWSTYLFLVHL